MYDPKFAYLKQQVAQSKHRRMSRYISSVKWKEKESEDWDKSSDYIGAAAYPSWQICNKNSILKLKKEKKVRNYY